jgi:hypothetical protein
LGERERKEKGNLKEGLRIEWDRGKKKKKPIKLNLYLIIKTAQSYKVITISCKLINIG